MERRLQKPLGTSLEWSTVAIRSALGKETTYDLADSNSDLVNNRAGRE